MKNLLILLVFLSTSLWAQELPHIESNISSDESEKSRLWNEFSKQYEQILSFTKNSYWSSEQVYILFVKEEQGWKRLKWKLNLDNDKKVIKSKVRKLSFNQNEFNELLDFFNMQNFWTLVLDSLNLHEEFREDGSSTLWTKTDGVTDSFEIIKDDQYRLISSYEPEYFQDLIPVEQREKFIKCRDKFLKLNKIK